MLPDDSAANGVQDDVHGVVDVELLQDAGTMAFHPARAYPEERGNLFVGLTFGNELEYLVLALRQRFVAIDDTAFPER